MHIGFLTAQYTIRKRNYVPNSIFLKGDSMFYDKGLRFECQMCRYCCSVEPGYVYLTKNDIEKASASLSLSSDSFIDKYCRLVDFGSYYLVSLQEHSNYDCIFLTPRGCGIYDARPLQCRTYPFWKNVMESEESWKKEALSCPGIGKGRIISRKEIEKKLRDGEEPPYVIIRKNS